MRDLAQQFQPHVWLNMHSGMEALFMPYDHRAAVPEGPEAAAALQLLQQLNRAACGGRCAVGSGGKSVGAPCPALALRLWPVRCPAGLTLSQATVPRHPAALAAWAAACCRVRRAVWRAPCAC